MNLNKNTVYINKSYPRMKKDFGYLEENNHIFVSPLIDYECPKYTKNHYPALCWQEIKSIFEKISTGHPLCLKGKTIIELACSSALRPREMYNLKLTDIDFKKGLLFIEQSKNRKDRIVPVGKVALNWRGNPFNRTTINKCVIGSILRKGLIEKSISCYSLHTIATHLLRNKVDIMYIAQLLGHDSLKTTQKYLRVEISDLKKMHSLYHPRERGFHA